MEASTIILNCQHEIARGFFCPRCKIFVCRQCPCTQRSSPCKSKLILIKDYLPELEKSVMKKIEFIKKVVKKYTLPKLENLINELEKRKHSNEQERSNLINYIQEELNKEEKKSNILIDNIIKRIKEFEKECRTNVDNLEEKIDSLEQLKENLDEIKKVMDRRQDMELNKANIIKGYMTYKDLSRGIIEFNNLKLRELELENEKAKETAFSKYGRKFREMLNEQANTRADYLYSLISNSNSMIVFDFHKNEGSIKQIDTSSKIIPIYPGITSDKDYIYVVGGTDDFIKPLDSAFKIGTKGGVHQLRKLNTSRYKNALAKLSNVLVCIGGHDDNGLLDTIELLDITEDASWACGPKLPFGLSLCSTVVTINDERSALFIYGGMYEEQGKLKISNTLLEFSLETKEVAEVRVEGAPTLHSAGMINLPSSPKSPCIMIFGGCNKLEQDGISDEVYLLKGHVITKENEKLKAKDSFFCGSIAINNNGLIYAMGNGMVHRYYEGKWEVLTDNYWLAL